ncbi:pyridoxal-5'-phosphate dependent enzyme family [Legionella lansingensis]|uniref:Pyridoxal phosphate homeostasis protein n=1 Tax=Legionella lansingensis TaxID=45067 RepID=A0A0W0VU62_9GAMM|nr:YggS family pyridoxal phosphate-dependent enzyme [Legionella lansingensis]KTD23735.1 pyridoxal-5'-phosphate dependent enzyme family transporter protein [Legionella lansingensis]SNV47610.1 pyridoxal-5'-phosphate dependent enzyme family [Legionella lansingensis]
MTTITQRVKELQDFIAATAKYYQRPPQEIHLLAVSKGHSVAAIQEAYNAGLRDFGENHYQEALAKMQALQDLSICWHFIGPIQSNKAKGIAQHFSWVHSLSRSEIAHLLNKHRPEHLPPLNVCIQVNLDKEVTKAGISCEQVGELVTIVNTLPKLKLRGLMAIPFPHKDEQKQYESFVRLQNLLLTLNGQHNLIMDTLSMGMSNDLAAAIRAGSTIVRIGRALFGERRIE